MWNGKLVRTLRESGRGAQPARSTAPSVQPALTMSERHGFMVVDQSLGDGTILAYRQSRERDTGRRGRRTSRRSP
jgi:hypothetical protein